MESDSLDAEIARRTGLAAQTMRNIRNGMRTEGLVRSVPEKDAEGEVRRWFVTLTGAGVAAALTTTSQIPPTHDLTVSGLNTPDTDLRVSVSGESRYLDAEPAAADFVTLPAAPEPTLDEALRDPALRAGYVDPYGTLEDA
jgi:hypothetical protein